jgi:hypothetical protein
MDPPDAEEAGLSLMPPCGSRATDEAEQAEKQSAGMLMHPGARLVRPAAIGR